MTPTRADADARREAFGPSWFGRAPIASPDQRTMHGCLGLKVHAAMPVGDTVISPAI
jgi:hypothetical protein